MFKKLLNILTILTPSASTTPIEVKPDHRLVVLRKEPDERRVFARILGPGIYPASEFGPNAELRDYDIKTSLRFIDKEVEQILLREKPEALEPHLLRFQAGDGEFLLIKSGSTDIDCLLPNQAGLAWNPSHAQLASASIEVLHRIEQYFSAIACSTRNSHIRGNVANATHHRPADPADPARPGG